jgi:hypothetical protein
MAVSLVKVPKINYIHPDRVAKKINYVHPDRVRPSTINLNHPNRPAIGSGILCVAA